MTDTEEWSFPEEAQPKEGDVSFDLDRALGSVLMLRSEVPEDAFTAGILGTEREGNAVAIDDNGLALTIGYLVAEAETIWLAATDGAAAPAHLVAYDYDTGFGLVQALGRLGVDPMEFGTTSDLRSGDPMIFAGHGGPAHALNTQLVGKREFAGYWEYVLDEALFTAPAHPNWGGAALIGQDGKLYGIGSLFVQNARGGEQMVEGNMTVPIDLLPPIMERLLTTGQTDQPPRPWLGFYVAEAADKLAVVGLAEGAPAHQAGVHPGDLIVDVAGAPVGDLADLFRTIWSVGTAGCEVPLTLWREGETQQLVLRSADRASFLKSPRLH